MALRLLVLGDSLSEGVGDPAPGLAGLRGRLRGWPAHLAAVAQEMGTPVEVTNLARAGAGVPEVVAGQLPLALRTPADAVVCLIGVNDVLRPDFDADAFATSYDALLADLARHLAGDGRTALVTARIHDVAAHLPLGEAVRARTRRRVAQANAAVERSAAAHGAVLLDGTQADDAVSLGGLLSIDRLHPNAAGHRRVADEVARALQEAGLLPSRPLPDPVPLRRRDHLASGAAHAVWLVRRAPGQLLRGRLPALRRHHHAPESG